MAPIKSFLVEAILSKMKNDSEVDFLADVARVVDVWSD